MHNGVGGDLHVRRKIRRQVNSGLILRGSCSRISLDQLERRYLTGVFHDRIRETPFLFLWLVGDFLGHGDLLA